MNASKVDVFDTSKVQVLSVLAWQAAIPEQHHAGDMHPYLL